MRLSWRSRRPLPRPDRSVPSFPSRVKEDNARPPADARADRQPLSASDQADRQPISASDQAKLFFERKASVRFTVAIGIGVNAHPLAGSAETLRFVSIWRIKSTTSIVGNILEKMGQQLVKDWPTFGLPLYHCNAWILPAEVPKAGCSWRGRRRWSGRSGARARWSRLPG